MTPILPNSVVNSQSSSFSTNKQYFTVELLLFEIFCPLAYQFSFFFFYSSAIAGFSISFISFFSFSYLLTLSCLGLSSLSSSPYTFFFSQWFNTVLGFKYKPCADNSQMYISSPDVYPELKHVLMLMYLIAIWYLTDIINPTGTAQNSDHPPETCSTSCLLYLTTNSPSVESPLTTLFPSHNPLGNNINFISKICLDSHCFSLSLHCYHAGPGHLHFSLCYFSRFWMSLPVSILPLYSPLSKSSQHFLSSLSLH